MITSFFKQARGTKRERVPSGTENGAEAQNAPKKTAGPINAETNDEFDISGVTREHPEAVGLHQSWAGFFVKETRKAYFKKLMSFVSSERKSKRIFPAQADTLTAYKLTPLSSIKVVILGQDPYHGPGQAHGLSFSVPRGVSPLPPSLRNMIKESESSLTKGSSSEPGLGDLSCWAAQGVFLLNTVLTVRAASANSHAKQGWETFTDATIKYISDNTRDVVFLLWGKSAQSKSALISTSKHLVLKSVHPSPLSAYRGFFGCGHFSKVNEHLSSLGSSPIDWAIKRVEMPATPVSSDDTAAAAASGSVGE